MTPNEITSTADVNEATAKYNDVKYFMTSTKFDVKCQCIHWVIKMKLTSEMNVWIHDMPIKLGVWLDVRGDLYG